MHANLCEGLASTVVLEPSDRQLLYNHVISHNHVIYHGRTAYKDADGSDSDRPLLRLWLAPSNSPALPPGFEALWGTTVPSVPRGGIVLSVGTYGNREDLK